MVSVLTKDIPIADTHLAALLLYYKIVPKGTQKTPRFMFLYDRSQENDIRELSLLYRSKDSSIVLSEYLDSLKIIKRQKYDKR